jgi:hypothetical protein
VLAYYAAYHNHGRPHRVRCQEILGGLLNDYDIAA